MILAWYRYGAVRGMCPVLTSGIIINPTSSIILLERMGNSQFSSSVEADDLFAARWSLVSALKQQQCSDQEIQRLLGHMHKTYGDDALMDLKDGNGRSILMMCIDRMLPQTIDYLMLYDKFTNIELKDNCYDWSACMYAISKNQYQIVERLVVKQMCNINGKDRNGMNCLMQASFQGFDKIVELLIANGANLNEVCTYLIFSFFQ